MSATGSRPAPPRERPPPRAGVGAHELPGTESGHRGHALSDDLGRGRVAAESAQIAEELAGGLVSGFWISFEETANDAEELGRNIRAHGGDGGGVGGQDRVKDGSLVVRGKGAPAGQHFVEDRTEGPQIAAAIDLLAGGLFGRHVGGCADDRALASHGGLSGELGKPEVHHLGLVAFCQEDIGRFDVAVDDAGFVCAFERRGDLDRQFHRLLQRHGALVDTLFEGRAGAVGHRDEELSVVGLADVENGADMGVIES